MSDTFCMICEQPLRELEYGSFAVCCTDVGYIYAKPPTPRDATMLMPPRKGPGYIYRNWFKQP